MTEDSGPSIRAEGLGRHYGRLAAVSEVSLAVRRGEILALLGPNGAGKTTTLSMLTGNLAPSAGRIEIAGHDLLERPQAAKRALGYLPEQPPLYAEMTVDEYLGFCARLHAVARAECRAAVAQARARCGLEGVANRLIGHLSKGYQQRIGIAQAIVHHPVAVILDEPTVGLDPVQIRATRELIRTLATDAALIVSTHLLAEAAEIATHVAILSHGRIVYEAAATDSAPHLRVEFGNPPAREHLAEIPGVTTVDVPRPGLFLLGVDAALDPRPTLLKAAVAGNWDLRTLARDQRSLEETFLAVVSEAPESTA